MDDLISRAAAKFQACNWSVKPNAVIYDVIKKAIKSQLDMAPAVDAYTVVRCSECKYAHMTYDGECKYCDFWQEDGGDALYLDKGFYCAAGERRDGDANG